MATINFSTSLSKEDLAVVSQMSLHLLSICAGESNNPTLTITSTLRPPQRQAKAMYDNLQNGRNILYAAPGREVIKVYNEMKSAEYSSDAILKAMTSKIEQLSLQGKLVSRHCVTPEQYAKENIIDIRTNLPNPRDFAERLAESDQVTKVITPFHRNYASPKIQIDNAEPAIHVQIKQT